ncbi:MAG: GNAT family N-acetyltransferase [Gaiellaceae bacterium]
MRIRTLEEGDRDLLFGPRLRWAADEWLARQRRDEIHVAVAEVEGVPVGRIGLDFTASGELGVVVLWAALVREEWRDRGVGTALMRHLEDVARDRGCSTVELLVAQDNGSALRLYGRLGYEICGHGVNRWVEQEGSVVEQFEEICWRMRKRLVDE